MFDRAAVVLQYDGTLEGLLTCVFVIYETRREPTEILTEDAPQEWLYPTEVVDTDPGKAERVYASLGRKISPEAQEWVEKAFRYGEGGKEMAIYRFIRLGLAKGRGTVRMFGHPDVAPIFGMVKAVDGEAHLLSGFIRFADLGGLLAAEIRPKHFVLPQLVDHFTDRYPEEQFLIHDKTHGAVLAYRPYETRLFFAQELRLPAAGEVDIRFQELWQGYFRSAAIAARTNPLCQRTHCPKRYWACMTELSGGNLLLEGPSRKGGLPGACVDKQLPGE